MIITYESYLYFMNVILIDLLHLIYQFIECYWTKGNVYAFPFKTSLNKL